MNDLTFTGVISQIGEIESKKSSTGIFNTREVLLTTKEVHPQSMLIQLVGEKASGFAGMVGQTATAHLTFKTFTHPTTGRKRTIIRCWRLDLQY